MMGWSELKGQSRIKKILQSAVDEKRPGQAYLFYGPPGVGKNLACECMVKGLFCTEPGGQWCGTCRICRRVEAGNYPDYERVATAEDAKSISIDQIRGLKEKLAFRPYESQHRVCVIDEAHRMTLEAQNTLLKLLEEPPESAVLILITENIDALVPTIRSRCQCLRFQPLSKEVLQEILAEKRPGCDPEEYLAACAMAEGSVEKALAVLGGEDEGEFRTQVLDLVSRFPVGDPLEVARIAQRYSEFEGSLDQFLHHAGIWFRDLLLIKEGGLCEEDLDKASGDVLINCDYYSQLIKMADRFAVSDILAMLERIEQLSSFLGGNVNAQLIYELFIIDLEDRGK